MATMTARSATKHIAVWHTTISCLPTDHPLTEPQGLTINTRVDCGGRHVYSLLIYVAAYIVLYSVGHKL